MVSTKPWEVHGSIWESAIFVNEQQRQDYETAFSAEGVEYSIRREGGVSTIEWNQLDGPKVDQILQTVDSVRMDDLIQRVKDK